MISINLEGERGFQLQLVNLSLSKWKSGELLLTLIRHTPIELLSSIGSQPTVSVSQASTTCSASTPPPAGKRVSTQLDECQGHSVSHHSSVPMTTNVIISREAWSPDVCASQFPEGSFLDVWLNLLGRK